MRNGFTLIEILIAISIVLIISSAGLPVLNKQREIINLSLATQKMVNEIKWSRNMAMMTVKNDIGGAQIEIPCGYGISFDTGNSNVYVIFAGNDDAAGDCGASNNVYNVADGDGIVKNITLPSRIEISNSNDFDIFFEPPKPTITITPASNPLVISLRVEGRNCPDYCRSITITSSGKIDY